MESVRTANWDQLYSVPQSTDNSEDFAEIGSDSGFALGKS